ncbi:hypothetical protein DERP_001304 [Dermatophagoides pteronyssinus]|uniref:Uncharacterized protein n=1 Tax=Dermatophagoides pteronyssinus TaxID=6956 RepID=A0ABQ8JEL1_DERPT|nr:hypothetical protein DERP_001304 [Dermatophagoides pteronyssinus]
MERFVDAPPVARILVLLSNLNPKFSACIFNLKNCPSIQARISISGANENTSLPKQLLPKLPRGTESNNSLNLDQLPLAQLSRILSLRICPSIDGCGVESVKKIVSLVPNDTAMSFEPKHIPANEAELSPVNAVM